MASLAQESQREDTEVFRQRLIRYYRKYNPDKLTQVESMLVKYAGHEARLFTALVDRYGPEPTEDDSDAESDELDSEEEGESKAHGTGQVDMSEWPCHVPLCSSAGLPFEYVEYSSRVSLDDCKEDLLSSVPNMMLQKHGKTVTEYFAEADSTSTAGEGGTTAEDGSAPGAAGEQKQATVDPNDPRAKRRAEKRERKRIAQERKKLANASSKARENMVRVKIKPRTKRKFIVTINGLEKYGVKLKNAAKKLSKKYACSATVSKNDMGKKEIVMSGNVSYDIPDVLSELFSSVPRDAIDVNLASK